ncbi:MAG TPA: amidohydrolase family protein [Nocardioides sp.]|uniref:amidohydrolase family protein n=1 Tax=Nocardioides sp. TaxID=35761 RepID=UPI002F41264B
MEALKAASCFDGERFRPGGVTLLLDGDRIAGVEPLAYDVPHGVEVTTYDGTLLPGLIDAHVHLVGDATFGGLERAGSMSDDELDTTITGTLRAQAAAGVTTVRDLGDVRYRTLVARDRRGPGEPRIVAAGPPITVPGGHCHYLGGAVTGVDEVRSRVAEHAERGVDLVKVMASGGMLTAESDVLGVQFTPEELRAAAEAAHTAGLRIVAHAHSEAGVRHAVAAGVDGLEHATCLSAAGLAVPEDLFREIAARDVTVDPTWGMDPDRVPPADQLPPNMRALVERFHVSPIDVLRGRAGQITRMRELGVRIVSGMDAGATPPKPHGSLWRVVVQLESAGFSAAEALATATSVAADDCRLTATTGRLAAGLAADLLVVDGDLESDLTALARPRAVRVRGVPI